MSIILHRSSLTVLYNEWHLAINHSETRGKGMPLLISMPFGSSRGHVRAGSYLNLHFSALDFPVDSGTLNTDFLNEPVPSGYPLKKES